MSRIERDKLMFNLFNASRLRVNSSWTTPVTSQHAISDSSIPKRQALCTVQSSVQHVILLIGPCSGMGLHAIQRTGGCQADMTGNGSRFTYVFGIVAYGTIFETARLSKQDWRRKVYKNCCGGLSHAFRRSQLRCTFQNLVSVCLPY